MNHEKTTVEIGDVTLQVPNHVIVKSVLEYLSPSKAPSLILGNSMPALGELWSEEGGIRVGEMRMGNTSQTCQLILPIDDKCKLKSEWGFYGKDISGAYSLWDGMANTKAMFENGIELAKRILDIEVDGNRDLFLPSVKESKLCFINAQEQFEKEWHWTSTQCSANSAFAQGFGGGYQSGISKVGNYLVRPVRRKI